MHTCAESGVCTVPAPEWGVHWTVLSSTWYSERVSHNLPGSLCIARATPLPNAAEPPAPFIHTSRCCTSARALPARRPLARGAIPAPSTVARSGGTATCSHLQMLAVPPRAASGAAVHGTLPPGPVRTSLPSSTSVEHRVQLPHLRPERPRPSTPPASRLAVLRLCVRSLPGSRVISRVPSLLPRNGCSPLTAVAP